MREEIKACWQVYNLWLMLVFFLSVGVMFFGGVAQGWVTFILSALYLRLQFRRRMDEIINRELIRRD